MAYFKFGGSEIYYKVVGRGEPLLMVHGMLSSHRNFEPFAKQLSKKGFKCILVDLPLHGKTKGFGMSINGVVSALRSLMTYLKIDHYHCMGHSLGASVCSVLNRVDRRSKSLIAMNPIVSDFRPMEVFFSILIRSLIKRKFRYHEMISRAFVFLMSPNATQKELDAVLSISLGIRPSSIITDVIMEAQINCGLNLLYTDKPLLVIAGKYDPLSSIDEIKKHLSGLAKLVVLKKAHSDIYPSDLIRNGKNTVSDFLKSVS
ncbi:MAG: alpha/beta hydrolase [Candidatus Altiarchaeota archaeon]|nr:alpha/beta hydrolase [Candidatus Altiarchaeota archaeon]